MELDRQKQLADHLNEVRNFEDREIEAISRLAAQLSGKEVLPVVGAGASFDCGMRLAGEIGEDLGQSIENDPEFGPLDSDLDPDNLADIAEGILRQKDQSRVVAELGVPDELLWKPSKTMGDHFCVYCVIARMVREGLIDKTLGFNYDCGAEAGLEAEGFVYEELRPGKEWPDYARVIADAEMVTDTGQGGAFDLYKAHGCAQRYRDVAADDGPKAAEGIVICRSQLEDWKTKAGWSRKAFNRYAEHHILVLIGFSAQDPKFSKELVDILEEVYASRQGDGSPRVVAIDYNPKTDVLEELIGIGYGDEGPADGSVAQVCTKDSTATAAMLLLLAEQLRTRLEPALAEEGLVLPTDVHERLGALVVGAPAMLRWFYLVWGEGENGFIQRANLMAQRGYVPLTQDPAMSAVTVRLLAARASLRERLGLEGFESGEELVKNHGFVADAANGRAFIPVGIEHEQLKRTCGVMSELEKIRAMLKAPRNLECILVSDDGAKLRGVDLATGDGVDLD